MADLYLQDLLGGVNREKESKNRFEMDIERQIEAYVSSLTFEESLSSDQLMSPEMQRKKIGAELIEASNLTELFQLMTQAFQILKIDRQADLMNEEFKTAKTALEQIDLVLPSNTNFQILLGLSESTIQSIFNIAVAKFNENQFQESLSLFVFLATLIPENWDYWYRSGILAQRCENYDLALRLYSTARALDPSQIAPIIFSIECYLKSDFQQEAKSAYAEAIKMTELMEVDESWLKLLSQFDAILKTV